MSLFITDEFTVMCLLAIHSTTDLGTIVYSIGGQPVTTEVLHRLERKGLIERYGEEQVEFRLVTRSYENDSPVLDAGYERDTSYNNEVREFHSGCETRTLS